jgi:hypothetical protein
MNRFLPGTAAAVMGLSATMLGGQSPTIELRPGLVITRSVRIAPTVCRLAAPASLDSSVVTIRGNDIGVDIAGATLDGAAPNADPTPAAQRQPPHPGQRRLVQLRDRLRAVSVERQPHRAHADYNVRGNSHGFYRRGQDSARLAQGVGRGTGGGASGARPRSG